MPVMFGVEHILDGSKTAVIVPAVTRDRFKAHADDEWHPIEALPIGKTAYAVSHFKQHTSTQGGIWTIRSILNPELAATVAITEIQLLRANELTQAHLDEIGPRGDTEALGFDTIEEMGERRIWFTRIMLASDTPNS